MIFPSKNTLSMVIVTFHPLYSVANISFEGRERQTEFWHNNPHFPLLYPGQLQGTFTCSMLQPGTGYVAIRAKLPLF